MIAFVIYKNNQLDGEFVKDLVMEVVQENMRRRAVDKHLLKTVLALAIRLLGIVEVVLLEPPRSGIKGNCKYCKDVVRTPKSTNGASLVFMAFRFISTVLRD
ncbi:hypothetical protein RN001_012606 [Aquatica leii]|uniref:Uncharacterized protein n=1 Tax=Aquatica leii TaxID=1421715 RepID=A0AAN7PT24_9COLE|nr:hypothetical protein RN001_012606 [Aquatica leii]